MSSNDSGISKTSTVADSTGIAIACFLAMAFYNVLELNVVIMAVFKKHSGLYFWSFVIATWGIAIHEIGFLLKDFQITNNGYIYVTIMATGWWAMVTGQSVVLYSRLHLVLYNRSWLRAVLLMIITNVIVCHIPSTVVTYGANSENSGPFTAICSIYEKIQVTLFFVQELIISGLYIYTTAKVLRIGAIFGGKTKRNILRHLLCTNLFIIILDVTILALEFSNLYTLQTAYKGFAYSVKLKLEFSILNRLIGIAQSQQDSSHSHSNDCGHTMQLESIDDYKDTGKSTRDKMKRGHRVYIQAGRAGDFPISRDLKNTYNSVLRTTEILITADGGSAQRQQAAADA